MYYISIYIILCSILFIIIFRPNETFNILFEKIENYITDYNDPRFTGGIEYIFNPFRHFEFKQV